MGIVVAHADWIDRFFYGDSAIQNPVGVLPWTSRASKTARLNRRVNRMELWRPQPPKPIRNRLARIEIMKRGEANHRRKVAERNQTHRKMAAASRRRNRGC